MFLGNTLHSFANHTHKIKMRVDLFARTTVGLDVSCGYSVTGHQLVK